jgi:predicted SnoaL-like aldol condensation-catalyzing enzyme
MHAYACSPEEEAANKRLVESLMLRPDTLEQALHPQYIQHNPEIARFAELNDLDARRATEEMGKIGRARRARPAPLAGQPRSNMVYKMLAECDVVVVVSQHWHPYPDDTSRFYATYFFNMWRIKDGKPYEHWDPADLPAVLPDFLRAPVPELKPAAH